MRQAGGTHGFFYRRGQHCVYDLRFFLSDPWIDRGGNGSHTDGPGLTGLGAKKRRCRAGPSGQHRAHLESSVKLERTGEVLNTMVYEKGHVLEVSGLLRKLLAEVGSYVFPFVKKR